MIDGSNTPNTAITPNLSGISFHAPSEFDSLIPRPPSRFGVGVALPEAGIGPTQADGRAGLRERAQEVLDFYASNLVAHFRAEEQVLFPLLHRRHSGNATMIDELIKDHDWIRHAVPKLRALTGLAKLIFDFGDLLERHIRKEERELFPLFEKEPDAIKPRRSASSMKTILETKQETVRRKAEQRNARAVCLVFRPLIHQF